MEISEELRLAVERVYNRCKEDVDVRNSDQLSGYLNDVRVFKIRLEESVGDMEINENNELHRRICREIQPSCTKSLPGSTRKRKIITHTTHFLQDIQLFYKELQVSAYCGICENHIRSTEKIDQKLIMGLNESKGNVLAIYSLMFPTDKRKDKDKIKDIENNQFGFNSRELQIAITEYKRDKKSVNDFGNQKDVARKSSISQFETEQKKSVMSIIPVLIQTLGDKFTKIKKEEGSIQVIIFLTRVIDYLNIIIFLRKLDLMCSKRRYYDSDMIRRRPSSSQVNEEGEDSATSHEKFISMLGTLKLMCTYYLALIQQ